MGIEYLSGVKPGDRIDLSRFERKTTQEKEINPDHYLPSLKEGLFNLSKEANKYLDGFLDDEGKISISGKDEKADLALIASQEDAFSRDFYGKKPEDMEAFQREKEKSIPNLTEIALTLLLDKFLKDRFIVARASSYDDYNNGVDNVLIDKKSGEVLCGFDEVVSRVGTSFSAKKEVKMERAMAKGGAKLKYGARLENGKLVRASASNIPAFYIPLDKKELKDLLEALKNEQDKDSSKEVMKKIFSKMLISLSDQISRYNLDDDLKNKTKAVFNKIEEVANFSKN